MPFLIQGESGATLDAVKRTPAALRARIRRIRYATLAPDVAVIELVATNSTGGGVTVPDEGQLLRIYQGTGGDNFKIFHGWVARREFSPRLVRVTVEGPWAKLAKTPLTEDQTLNGTTRERVVFSLAQGGLSNQIIAVAERLIALGVPMQIGTFAGAFSAPKRTLPNMTGDRALIELMKWFGDAVLYFDHEQTDGGLPALTLRRRGANMTTRTLDMSVVDEEEFRRVTGRRTRKFFIHYLDRHPVTTKPRLQQLVSGSDPTGDETRHVTLAGPGIVGPQRLEDFESHTGNTFKTTDLWFQKSDSALVATKKKYGSGVTVSVANGQTFSYWTTWEKASNGPVRNGGTSVFKTLPMQAVNRNGVVVSTAGSWFLKGANPPDWVRKLPGVNFRDVTVTGMVYYQAYKPVPFGSAGSVAVPVPEWAKTYGMQEVAGGYNAVNRVKLLVKEFSIQGILVNQNWTPARTLYKPPRWTFAAPPAPLAENLVNSWNWQPWEGPIKIVEPGTTCQNQLHRTICLSGAGGGAGSADALLRFVEFDPMRNRVWFECGPPPQLNMGTMVSNIKQEEEDVIIEL